MTAITLKKFAGMFPRTPNVLLPDSAASYAQNCDFAKDVLGALKGGTPVMDIEAGTVAGKGLYTLDGLFWYTWSTEVVAFKSPVIGDSFHRIYYIENNTMYAAISPESTGSPGNFITGGNPASKWVVGVPNPVVAPTLTLVDRTTLADYPAAAFKFSVWWLSGGVKYGEQSVTVNTIQTFKKYTVIVPAIPGGTPTGAVLVVQAQLVEDFAVSASKAIFTLNTDVDNSEPVRSAALPGGVEMSVSLVSGVYSAEFNWGVVETRAYLYTVQNDWNEESGPSPAALISPTYLQDVMVATQTPVFTNYRPWLQTNIYRTYGSGAYLKTTAGLFSTQANIRSYLDTTHTVGGASTGLISLDWAPPTTGMFGLVLLPNGWFAAFKDNVLYMSEPYRPHAWPYAITFPKAITGICVGAQSLVVTTYETAYLVLGPHPASVSQQELNIPVGGISQRSMVKFEGGVAYLSNDGIVVVNGSNASLDLSQNFFTRDAWRSLFSSSLPNMALGYHDGFLVCVDTTSAVGFVVRLDEAQGALSRFDFRFTAMMRLPVLDSLYYISGGRVFRFRDLAELDATWYSKEFIFPDYVKFGVGFARMTGSGTITVQLWGDDALVHTQVLTATNITKYFRLPPHAGSLKWQFRITLTGSCELMELAFGHTMTELKRV